MRLRMDDIHAAVEAEATRWRALTPAQRAAEADEAQREKTAMLVALADFDPQVSS